MSHSLRLVGLLLSVPVVAHADLGDLAAGPSAGAGYPSEGRAGALLRVGLGDWLALDLRLGLATDGDRLTGVGSAGVVAAWDVLAWVPELRLAAGGRVGASRVEPRIIGELGVRHYLALEISLVVGAGVEWSPGAWSGVASAALLFALP